MSQLEPQPPTDADTAVDVEHQAVEHQEVDEGAPAGVAEPAGAPSFTSAEKVASVIAVLQARLETDDSSSAKVIRRVFKVLTFTGVKEQLVAQLPLEDAEQLDAMLAFACGLALALMSDGLAVDVEAAREESVRLLGTLYEQ